MLSPYSFHGHKACWLSELGILVVHPSGESLKWWGIRCGVQTFHLSGRSWELWAPFWFYVAVLGVRFMTRVCFSFSYLFPCGYFLIIMMYRNCSTSSWIFFRGNCYMCSCRFDVPGRKWFQSLLIHYCRLKYNMIFFFWVDKRIRLLLRVSYLWLCGKC